MDEQIQQLGECYARLDEDGYMFKCYRAGMTINASQG